MLKRFLSKLRPKLRKDETGEKITPANSDVKLPARVHFNDGTVIAVYDEYRVWKGEDPNQYTDVYHDKPFRLADYIKPLGPLIK
jgi:hypothetical protein